MTYEIGKTYLINHTRKGSFFLQITGQCSEWLTGIVVGGTAKAILDYNVKEKGDEITIRKSFIRTATIQPEPKAGGVCKTCGGSKLVKSDTAPVHVECPDCEGSGVEK